MMSIPTKKKTSFDLGWLGYGLDWDIKVGVMLKNVEFTIRVLKSQILLLFKCNEFSVMRM